MTDKQIMIDGVDVSNCENYNPKGRFTCNPHICNCHQKPNCYYKQLKRKEQECKKLKNKIELLEEELSVIQHNCNREGCKYYDDDTFKVFYECKAQKALQLSANSVTTKYCDLLRTLAEIKEIVKYDVYTTRADLCLRLNWIKKKISECEVKND